MSIHVQCSQCGQQVQAGDRHAGSRVKCPGCGSSISIPDIGQPADVSRRVTAPRNLQEAIELDHPAYIAAYLQQQEFYLIEDPEQSDEESSVPWTALVDGFPAVLVFTSQQHVGEFAYRVPSPDQEDGSVSAFTIEGWELLNSLEPGAGILLNPETDDVVVFPPDEVEQFQTLRPPRRPRTSRPTAEDEDSRQANAVREQSMDYLRERGFRPADWLPLPDVTLQLRPPEEIAGRLLALNTVFTWAAAPKEAVASADIRRQFRQERLRSWLTDEEYEIVRLLRQEALELHGGSVGWRLENMWPLAWVLGFEPEPTIEASQIGQDVSRGLMFEFLQGTEDTTAGLLERSKLRSSADVIELEDRFYCAHNAVRGAQLGSTDQVPDGFDPQVHGGVVHERRHALTWCLSPETDWDDTDLST